MCYCSSVFPMPQTLAANAHTQCFPLNVNRISQPQHCWHLGLENSSFWSSGEEVLWFVWCLIVPTGCQEQLPTPCVDNPRHLPWLAELHQLRTMGLKQACFPSEDLINSYKVAQTAYSARLLCQLTHASGLEKRKEKSRDGLPRNPPWADECVVPGCSLATSLSWFMEMCVWRHGRWSISVVCARIMGHERAEKCSRGHSDISDGDGDELTQLKRHFRC